MFLVSGTSSLIYRQLFIIAANTLKGSIQCIAALLTLTLDVIVIRGLGIMYSGYSVNSGSSEVVSKAGLSCISVSIRSANCWSGNSTSCDCNSCCWDMLCCSFCSSFCSCI